MWAGELNSIVKNKEEVEVRFAFCFPDVYEGGNVPFRHENFICGQFNSLPICGANGYLPLGEYGRDREEKEIPLYGLEEWRRDPIKGL